MIWVFFIYQRLQEFRILELKGDRRLELNCTLIVSNHVSNHKIFNIFALDAESMKGMFLLIFFFLVMELLCVLYTYNTDVAARSWWRSICCQHSQGSAYLGDQADRSEEHSSHGVCLRTRLGNLHHRQVKLQFFTLFTHVDMSILCNLWFCFIVDEILYFKTVTKLEF